MIQKLRVTVDGKSYDVTVEMAEESGPAEAAPPLPASAPPVAPASATAPPAAAAKASAALGEVQSPLMGRVVGVDVKAGQEVTQGQQLLIIETMKMNTFVLAPKGGKVAEVLVSVGQAVEEGQILARIA
ncbi:MAG: biotin/lipoyl-containing protein [Verrucomicrobiota bacterium]|jgi:biotin carboxyl carrier protein